MQASESALHLCAPGLKYVDDTPYLCIAHAGGTKGNKFALPAEAEEEQGEPGEICMDFWDVLSASMRVCN
jgi:hypothetical protein